MRVTKEKAGKAADTGILVLAFLIPSGLYMLDMAVLVFIGICRIIEGSVRVRDLRKPAILFPVLLYLYIFGGFFFSANKGEALSAWSEKLPYLLFPIFIGASGSMGRDLVYKALRFFVLSVLLAMATAILFAGIDTLLTHTATIQRGESIYNKFTWYGLTRVYGDWHPTCVSAFCNLSIAILLYYAIRQDRWFFRRQWHLIAAILFLGICVCLLYSVMGMITLGCLLIFYLFKWMQHRRLLLSVRLGIALGVAVLLAGLLYANPLAMDKITKLRSSEWVATDKQDQRNVLTMRMAKWKTHWQVFQQHWLFGATVGDIKEIRKKEYEKNGFTDLARYNYNAHNQYIEVLATYGVIGVLLFAGMLGTAAIRSVRSTLLTTFLLSTLLLLLTESLLERQQGLSFFLFFYSLLTLPWVSGNENPLRILRR